MVMGEAFLFGLFKNQALCVARLLLMNLHESRRVEMDIKLILMYTLYNKTTMIKLRTICLEILSVGKQLNESFVGCLHFKTTLGLF